MRCVGEAFYAVRPGLFVIYGSGAMIEPTHPVPGSKLFPKPYLLDEIAEACARLRPY